jgi:hypothetical protein
MTKLTKEIIERYAISKTKERTDHSDFTYNYNFKNGMVLSSLYISEGEPVIQDCLEGYEGYIYIDTESELKELIEFDEDFIECNPEEAATLLKKLCA